MRSVVTLTATLLFIVAPVSVATARQHKHQAKRHVRHSLSYVAHEPRHPNAADWYPHDTSKLPFGSAVWWDQMQRERRFNGESP